MMARISDGLVISAFLLLVAKPAAAQDAIVTYGLLNRSSTVANAVPVTFGAVFAPGDVPAGRSLEAVDEAGHVIPIQVDVKAKNPDGSLRHAVVTGIIPRLGAHGQDDLSLKAAPPAAAARAVSIADLPKNLDATVTLKLPGRTLSASLAQAISSSKPFVWLNGPLVSEWFFSIPFQDGKGVRDRQLTARFGVRSYGAGRPLRIEVVVENGWTFVPHPSDVGYDAEITLRGQTVYSQKDMVHYSHARWRKVFWWDDEPEIYVKPDLKYLKKTRIISNYDPALRIPDRVVASLYAKYQAADNGPMGASIVTKYMPMTGGRMDIGPLPAYTVVWLLTMDPRAYDIVRSVGDTSGSWPIHYRNEKTGRPVTVAEYPFISTHGNLIGQGPTPLPLVDHGKFPLLPLHPDPAHQPSLAFIPYVVTGDYYYLEELQFWTEWNVFGTAPENRGMDKGLVKWDQVRAQAWSLRTLAQTAFITPENDSLKKTLLRQLKANIDWYNQNYTNNPNANKLHFALPPVRGPIEVSPWQDDFLTWAAGYVVQLGYNNALPFLRWKAEYPTQRMINPDYCWILGAPYRMEVQKPDFSYFTNWKDAYRATFLKFVRNGATPETTPCNSEEMAAAFKLGHVGEMTGYANTTQGFPSNMQPGLAAAVDSGIPGAKEAWAKFEARAIKPNYNDEPEWDVVPWSEN